MGVFLVAIVYLGMGKIHAFCLADQAALDGWEPPDPAALHAISRFASPLPPKRNRQCLSIRAKLE